MMLLAYGADPLVRDRKGRLPIDGLREQSYADDFYDGHRLESGRERLIAELEKAMALRSSGD